MKSKKNYNEMPLGEAMSIMTSPTARNVPVASNDFSKLVKVALFLGGAALCFKLAKDTKTKKNIFIPTELTNGNIR